jgi:hypothetical protein
MAVPSLQRRLEPGRIVSLFINERYWGNEYTRKQLMLWLGIGILLRALLMPFTASNDYLDSHWRSEQMVEGRVPYPTRTQFLSHALDAAWLALITPLLPDRARVFLAPAPQDGRLDAQPIYFELFVLNPSARWALFLTKLIYFIVDIATGMLLLRLFQTINQGLYAFKLWMINPAMLYGVFIYGRYETYAIFCLVLSLLLIKHEKIWLAAFALGMAIAFRSTPILLLPIYALAVTRNRTKQIFFLALSILPQLLVILFMEVIFGFHPTYDVDHSTGPVSMLTNAVFNPVTLFPFVVCYVILLLWIDQHHPSFMLLLHAALAVYLLMYAFAWHSPHYISWLAPFIIPLLAGRPVLTRYYWMLLLAWAAYWAVVPNSAVFTTYVFSPLFGHIQLSTPPGEALAGYLKSFQLDQNQLGTAMRSMLSAIALWLLYQLRTVDLKLDRNDAAH